MSTEKKQITLKQVYEKMLNRTATEKERTRYATAVTKQIKASLERYRNSMERLLIDNGLGAWAGEEADAALTQAAALARQGKSFYEVPFLKDLKQAESEQRNLSRKGFDFEAHKVAHEKELLLGEWYDYLTDVAKTITDTLHKRKRSATKIRFTVMVELATAAKVLEGEDRKKFFQELRAWEIGRKTLGRTYQTFYPDYYSETASNNLLSDIEQMKKQDWEEIETYDKLEKRKVPVLTCSLNASNLSLPQLYEGLRMRPFDSVTKTLLLMCVKDLLKQNKFRGTTETNAKKTVEIDIRDFARICGISNLNYAQKQLRFATQQLRATSASTSGFLYRDGVPKEEFEFDCDICTAALLIKGKGVALTFFESFVVYIANTYTFRIPLELFGSLSPNSQGLLYYVLNQRDIAANKGNKVETLTRSVPKLLDACPDIPRDTQLTQGQRKNLRRAVLTPFLDALNEIQQTGEVRYTLLDPNGTALSPDNHKSIKPSVLRSLYVRFEFPSTSVSQRM